MFPVGVVTVPTLCKSQRLVNGKASKQLSCIFPFSPLLISLVLGCQIFPTHSVAEAAIVQQPWQALLERNGTLKNPHVWHLYHQQLLNRP